MDVSATLDTHQYSVISFDYIIAFCTVLRGVFMLTNLAQSPYINPSEILY